MSRIKKLVELSSCDAILITNPSNLYYYSGIQNSDSVIIATNRDCFYITDDRYIEFVNNNIKGFITISTVKQKDKIIEILSNYSNIGVEGSLSLNSYLHYKNELINSNITVIDSFIDNQRMTKDDSELDIIKLSTSIAEKSYLSMLNNIHEGMSEVDVVVELEYIMKKNGAECTSFDIIVAFGENTSEPHHIPTNRYLKTGDIVTIDFGAKKYGYCSDITRTFGYGRLDSNIQNVYNIILEANKLVIDSARSGMRCNELDAIARNYIKSCGFEGYFIHGTGHGIGIDIHEKPSINASNSDLLQKGCVISDEPGIYLSGEFGVRIEDMLYINEKDCNVITTLEKKLIII